MLVLLELNAMNTILAKMQLRRKWVQSHAIKFAEGIDRVRQLLISFNFIFVIIIFITIYSNYTNI